MSGTPHESTFADALSAVSAADEVHVHVDPAVFGQRGIFAQVTKNVARELLHRRKHESAALWIAVTHAGGKVWLEPPLRAARKVPT